MIYPLADDSHRLEVRTAYLPAPAPRPRRDVRFGLHLDQESRERLDRLAALQGVSRTTIIARSLRLLETACEVR